VSARSLARIAAAVPRCRRCPELRAYCARVAREKRRAFAEWEYWGRPVSGFGDPRAKVWILGLAPAAHGANRTGRMFTGDRSGEFLYAALHRAGLANRATSESRGDGLRLAGVYVSAALRCAPPENRPTKEQLAACSAWLDAEHEALGGCRVLLCLGAIAWDAGLELLERRGAVLPRPRPRFVHGRRVELAGRHVLGCYHVSQQNTFTGRLTAAMLDEVLSQAKALADLKGSGSRAAGSRSSPRSRIAGPRVRSPSP
jgi:uracil-DNA glycosylase family 4